MCQQVFYIVVSTFLLKLRHPVLDLAMNIFQLVMGPDTTMNNLNAYSNSDLTTLTVPKQGYTKYNTVILRSLTHTHTKKVTLTSEGSQSCSPQIILTHSDCSFAVSLTVGISILDILTCIPHLSFVSILHFSSCIKHVV